MPQTAEKKLKEYFKDCFKGDNKKIFILVRVIRKKLMDIKIKDESKSGVQVLRIHTDDEKSPTWYLHGYTIPIKNLGIEFKNIKKKRELFTILNNPIKVPDQETKALLRKLNKDFGDILDDGSRNKLTFKTEKFKKQKDPYRVKRKAL